MSVQGAQENYFKEIFASLVDSDALKEVAAEFGKGVPTVVVSGRTGSAKASFLK